MRMKKAQDIIFSTSTIKPQCRALEYAVIAQTCSPWQRHSTKDCKDILDDFQIPLLTYFFIIDNQ